MYPFGFLAFFTLEIHPRGCVQNVFMFIGDEYSVVWTDPRLFNHSPSDGHVGCFQMFLAIRNKVAINTCFCVNVISYFSGISAWECRR